MARRSAHKAGIHLAHFGDGIPRQLRAVTGVELSSVNVSNKFRPSVRPAANAAVSVLNCLYRLNGVGDFTGASGTWSTARFIELYVVADTDEYLKTVTGIVLIGGVEYTFPVTTRAE